MIFVTGQDGSMFLMLAEKDIEIMRQGNTKFVDERQTGGKPFTKAVLSLHKSDEEAVALLRGVGHAINPQELKKAEPRVHETFCKGCKCITEKCSLLDEYCIICWRNMAVGRQPVQDGQHQHGRQNGFSGRMCGR